MELEIEGKQIPLKCLQFPGGERHIRFDSVETPDKVSQARIRADLRSSNDLMDLFLLTDAVRREYIGGIDLHLLCPYFPYARQDRVTMPGEPLSVAVMAKLINAQGYASVEIWDAHSDVTTALIENLNHKQPDVTLLEEIGATCPIATIVIPDAGAIKRVSKIAQAARLPFILAEKRRNTVTGEITDTLVHDLHRSEGPYLIIDDICDGGRTFIEIAKAIRVALPGSPRPTVALYVTHGIFSKGFEELAEHLDFIFTANPFASQLPDFVRVI